MVCTDGNFSQSVIMEQSPHYINLPIDDREWLLSKLSDFYRTFDEFGYVPEEKFDQILAEGPNIDNSTTCPCGASIPK